MVVAALLLTYHCPAPGGGGVLHQIKKLNNWIENQGEN